MARRKRNSLQQLLDREIFIPAAMKHGVYPTYTGFGLWDGDEVDLLDDLDDGTLVFGGDDEGDEP